jgi:hypothetical protein
MHIRPCLTVQFFMQLATQFYIYIYIYSEFRLKFRYYKNSVDQKPGWNRETIAWCKHEAERQKLKEQDYWGCLVLDEMKIQV